MVIKNIEFKLKLIDDENLFKEILDDVTDVIIDKGRKITDYHLGKTLTYPNVLFYSFDEGLKNKEIGKDKIGIVNESDLKVLDYPNFYENLTKSIDKDLKDILSEDKINEIKGELFNIPFFYSSTIIKKYNVMKNSDIAKNDFNLRALKENGIVDGTIYNLDMNIKVDREIYHCLIKDNIDLELQFLNRMYMLKEIYDSTLKYLNNVSRVYSKSSTPELSPFEIMINKKLNKK